MLNKKLLWPGAFITLDQEHRYFRQLPLGEAQERAAVDVTLSTYE